MRELRVFEVDDLVLDSEFLALQIGERFHVRQGAAGFQIDGLFQAAMPGTECFDMILQRHGTSCIQPDEGGKSNANAVWRAAPRRICSRCLPTSICPDGQGS